MQNNSSSGSNGNVTLSFPSALLEAQGIINISIDNRRSDTRASTDGRTRNNAPALDATALDAEEIKKLEQETDFSECEGYVSNFLKVNVPLPKPKTALLKFIAKQKNGRIVLPYYNYSVIFHAVRRMPVISAANVEGDMSLRRDKEARKDNWLRDTRISFDVQLDDDFYRGSGFDRGHMSRREDANWGDNSEDAKRNADLTCMYTNACPQSPGINQSSRSGLWGILEKVVLEKGVERESRRTARISVFNGPVFKTSDPVFRGAHLPMDFYKIVLWLTDAGALKATAFKLSQKNEVGDIDFEQLDIDLNTEFKEYQCSIRSLEKDTGIDFSHIAKFDTFDAADGHEKAITVNDVAAHIAKHAK